MPHTLAELNSRPSDDFVRIVGPVFEHSPWIAAAVAGKRPFASREALHNALCDVVRSAPEDHQLELIRAHPDLVARAVLTAESTREQATAGLADLTRAESELFRNHNAAYRARFGFPFVICARQNKKDAILQAFPLRLKNSRAQEIAAALREIYQIAALRLADLVP